MTKLLRETMGCSGPCLGDTWHSVRLLTGPPGSARLYTCLRCGTKTEACKMAVAQDKDRRSPTSRKARFRVH